MTTIEAPTLLIPNADVAELASKILCGVASEFELRTAKLDEVLAIKRDTGAIHYRALTGRVTKDAKKGERTRRYVASAESRDRMGDVIRVGGWTFDDFAKNPVACWGHETEKHPIGTVSDWSKGRVGDIRVLKESITYFGSDVNPIAEQTLRVVDAMVALDLQPAVSVGFLPIKARMPTEDEVKLYGMPGWGIFYEEQSQLELSNVTVPAHPGALYARALEGLVKTGQVTREVADAVLATSERRQRVFALGAPEVDDEPAKPDTNAEVLAELKALRAENAQIRAENAAVYGSCQRLLERAESRASSDSGAQPAVDRQEPDGTVENGERRMVLSQAGSAELVGRLAKGLTAGLS